MRSKERFIAQKAVAIESRDGGAGVRVIAVCRAVGADEIPRGTVIVSCQLKFQTLKAGLRRLRSGIRAQAVESGACPAEINGV